MAIATEILIFSKAFLNREVLFSFSKNNVIIYSLMPFNSPPRGGQFTDDDDDSRFERYRMIGLAVIGVLVVAGMLAFIFEKKPKPGGEIVKDNNPVASSTDDPAKTATSGSLLLDNGDPGGNASSTASSTEARLRAETLQFGDFYKRPGVKIEDKTEKYKLPLNIKSDASNYYEFSRKINLDSAITGLNKNGFGEINNPFPAEAKDFFSAYGTLIERDIPLIITADSLAYYYLNTIKGVFRETEGNYFYRELWEVSSKFFDISRERYMARKSKMGQASDFMLEGERLEAAYFAVVLELLKPQKEQIYSGAGQNDKLFSEFEGQRFSFELPSWLKADVEKETASILKGVGKEKSPVLLYEKDYSEFKVPEDYARTAKTNNFYLATRWLNSPYPLYPSGKDCPKCYLDRDDFLRNMIAGSWIVSDFARNQPLKNRWAKIYKAISFSRGLRKDLTYLQYDEAFKALFGQNYDIESILSEGKDQEINIGKLTGEIEKNFFSELEGGYSRSDAGKKPNIGMRILQEPYWPNDFLFSRLTAPNTGAFKGDRKGLKKDDLITACFSQEKAFRCRAFGPDITALIAGYGIDDAYFRINTAYERYAVNADGLRSELDKFNDFSWHSNIFWSMLYAEKEVFKSAGLAGPAYMLSSDWKKRNMNSALGAWAFVQMPPDQLQYQWQREQGLSSAHLNDEYVYVEPNITLISELAANTDMVFNMLVSLGTLTKLDPAYARIEEIKADLAQLRLIAEREMKGELLPDADRIFITSFAGRFAMLEKAAKTKSINFSDNNKIIVSLEDLDYLVLANKFGKRIVLGAGPVFKETEATH
jgi:hypothetical protein